MSWETAAWLSVWVVVKRSKSMPRRFQLSRNSAWYSSNTSSGTDAALLGSQRYGGAVGVAPGDHQDIVALEAVVSGEDVGWQVAACDLSEVYGSVGVGPRYSYENALGHIRHMVTQWCPHTRWRRTADGWEWVV